MGVGVLQVKFGDILKCWLPLKANYGKVDDAAVTDEEMQPDEIIVSDSEAEDSFEAEDLDLDVNFSSDANEVEKVAEDDKEMEEKSDTND